MQKVKAACPKDKLEFVFFLPCLDIASYTTTAKLYNRLLSFYSSDVFIIIIIIIITIINKIITTITKVFYQITLMFSTYLCGGSM